MRGIVITNEVLKEELLQQGLENGLELEFFNELSLVNTKERIDFCIDLLFEEETDRLEKLKNIPAGLFIISLVAGTLESLPSNYIRINAWNSFLKRPLIEASAPGEEWKQQAGNVFTALNKKTRWVPDVPGFVTARVIAMIINEAYFALEEGVSTRGEIDIAMKLGTNYPYGPFEWSQKIGLRNIYTLLERLAKDEKRYMPAPLLITEALS